MSTRERRDSGAEIHAAPGAGTPAIEARALTKVYGRSRGIEDITLSVAAGEVFGFVGANGAGKTTLIRTLLDLQRPTSGRATLLGLDSHRDSVQIRTRVGNLPGGFGFDAARSGHELLRYLAGLRGMPGLGRAPELAERFSADLDRPLGHLSRGSRQKVGLIQAMFHEPELLILDEPTSGLDPIMQEEFLVLAAEERAAGRTVFLSSHNLAEVQRICDRVAIIRDGRLLAVETVGALRQRALRKVSVTFADGSGPEALASIAGVRDVRVAGQRTFRFAVAGDLDPLLQALASRRVADLTIEAPDVEDAFLAYYGAEEAPA